MRLSTITVISWLFEFEPRSHRFLNQCAGCKETHNFAIARALYVCTVAH